MMEAITVGVWVIALAAIGCYSRIEKLVELAQSQKRKTEEIDAAIQRIRESVVEFDYQRRKARTDN
jgi:hypothetical protein